MPMPQALVTLALLANLLCINAIFGQKYEYYDWGDEKHLVGYVGRYELTKGKTDFWSDSMYNHYRPDVSEIKYYRKEFKNLFIDVYLGTWDKQSQEEVPKFLKLMDSVGYPKERIRFFSLDHRPDKFLQGKDATLPDKHIFALPTFIVKYKGKELDRIVEQPWRSYGQDLWAIFDGKRNYIPYYPLAHILSKQIEELGVQALLDNEKYNLPFYQELTASWRSLSGLGKVYADSNRPKEAEYILRLNTKLYPRIKEVWTTMGAFFVSQRDWEKAKLCYENILKSEPSDIESIRQLRVIKENMAN